LRAVEEFRARLDVLEFSAKAAAHFGQMRAALERAGRSIGPHDLLIAAHARAEGLTVVTDDAREFGRIEGLRMESWS
jgi:tRNA(fMet)-specific endonuclease VapC